MAAPVISLRASRTVLMPIDDRDALHQCPKFLLFQYNQYYYEEFTMINYIIKLQIVLDSFGTAFWGADDEEPVAPPSPDYIPGPEDPQTPPVPQDEDEREPMFVQAHDPDYVPEPIYPDYIPLEDEHEFPAKEQPLPPVDSPTVESPGYVIRSDPEEDPEEYEDDETEDGPVDYPMDEGDDGDDDDDDSSGDDADCEDEDDEDEEEEHLAPADSAIVVPVDEPASISLPPEAEVERLLAMTTSSPSPPISLSPPSAGERLIRSMAPPVHASPPPVPSPLLPSSGCPTQIQTLRIASTQALIDAVTAALPSSPLPPLPLSLYIPPPVDRRDDIPESEQPPCKRLYLSTLGSRYEVKKSSTARPTRGRGIDYRFVSTVDAEERVTELAELHEHDTQDLYALLEDAQDSRSRISQRTHQSLSDHRDHVYAHEDPLPSTSTHLAVGYSHSDTASGPEARIPDHQDASGDADSHI
ncbi:hypothetical protein Tco_1088449 [Tanacetum coccineum]